MKSADFQGRALVQLEFAAPPEAEQIRAAVTAGGHDGESTLFGTGNSVVIRMPAFQYAPGSNVRELVRQALSEHFPPTRYKVARVEYVGPGRG